MLTEIPLDRFFVSRLCRSLLVSTCVALWACATAGTMQPPNASTSSRSQAAGRPHVVVLSFDGFGRELYRARAGQGFRGVSADGVEAESLTPVFPSKTFAIHYTMATGLHPGESGIVGNRFYDPARRSWFSSATVQDSAWFGGEPIWVTAERQGVRTAVYNWTGSEAAINGIRPSDFRVYDPKTADSTKIDQVAEWLRRGADARPRLIMAYFSGIDEAGHLTGPASKATYEAIDLADAMVRRMRDSIAALPPELQVDLVIVSDHGMASTDPSRVMDVSAAIEPAGIIVSNERTTLSLWATTNAWSAAEADSVATAVARVAPHARVYRRGNLPAAWQTQDNARYGDVIAVAEEGWVFGTAGAVSSVRAGEHGYDGHLDSMRGIFLAAGPHFRSGARLPPLDHTVLYSLLCRILRIRSAPEQIRDLSEVVRVMRK